MTPIQIDPALQQQLNGTTDPVAFCDAQGRVLGHFLPEEHYTDLLYASYEMPLSEEEIARRIAEPGGCSLAEIWRQLGQT